MFTNNIWSYFLWSPVISAESAWRECRGDQYCSLVKICYESFRHFDEKDVASPARFQELRNWLSGVCRLWLSYSVRRHACGILCFVYTLLAALLSFAFKRCFLCSLEFIVYVVPVVSSMMTWHCIAHFCAYCVCSSH